MTPSHHCVMAQNLAEIAQNLEYVHQNWKSDEFLPFNVILGCFYSYYVNFWVFYAHFVRKIYKSKTLTAQENQLLECLLAIYLLDFQFRCRGPIRLDPE